MPKFPLQALRSTKPAFSHASVSALEEDTYAAQFEQAFEPFVISTVEEPEFLKETLLGETDHPIRARFKFKHPLTKRALSMVRPSGTRRSQPKTIKADQSKSVSVATALAAGSESPDFLEFESILFRMVDRIVKLLQAEKCVFLMHDSANGMLQAVSPARGFSADAAREFQVPVNGKGLTARVFRTGKPVILNQVEFATSPLASAEDLAEKFGARSAMSVPLFIEKRDENNQIISSDTIGVAHVFNKIAPQGFTDDDRTLLVKMSRNAASIFNSARAFREVVHEKQELIQTLDSLYVGMMMVGLDGRIIQINPAARVVLGIGQDAPVTGVRYESVVNNKSFDAVIGQALGGLDPVEFSGEVTAKVGHEERVYQAHCAPVKDHEQKLVVGLLIFLNDITEIRGVDRMKTAFISTVSHELRTPLTSIKGFIATLLADDAGFYDMDTQREFYRIIDTECDRLTRLIDDLLNVSRIEQGQTMQLSLQQIDTPAIVQKVVSVQKAASQSKKHKLEVEFPSDFPKIEADADKIEQILTNLINNAIKYSPSGGIVLVAGGVEPYSAEVHFSVADHGMGIPREHIKRIFERFHRVDNRDNREIGGTGIGLYLVKALVDSHHGSIKVESELGRGSVFTVTLPIRQPAGAS